MYFKKIETLEELKKRYKQLALKNHPDVGGDVETMKKINAEYDKVFSEVKNFCRNKDGEIYNKATTETEQEFKDIINEVLKMNKVIIEIIGTFIWLSGDTKPYKEQIKKLKFRYSANKEAWYKSPANYRRKSKYNYNMNDIRGMFGVQYSAEGKEDEKARIEG
jgi:curved DNA-binding protein CbpA